jgi:HAMP domain-containing protein
MVIRRLIAPSVITLVMLGLWVDYLFFRDSSWSATQFLAKALTILLRIFAPLFDPALYWWIGEVIVPVVMIPCGIILLYVSVAKAKVAMSKATPSVDDFVPLPVTKPAVSEPAFTVEAGPPRPAAKPWKFGLVGKLAASFGVLSLLFGVAASVIVYTRMEGALEKEIKRRAEVFTASLAEIAARSGGSRGDDELRNAIDKYSSSRSVAYIYVEDGEGRIVAHKPRELPIFLRRDFPKSAERALAGVDIEYRGVPIYEIAVSFGDAKLGYAHLAIWRDVVQEETRKVIAPVAGSILVLLSGVTVLFAWVVWKISLPFSHLVEFATRISKGELDLNMGITDTDEVGDIARSFDRMRSSLHAVLSRLEEAADEERTHDQG